MFTSVPLKKALSGIFLVVFWLMTQDFEGHTWLCVQSSSAILNCVALLNQFLTAGDNADGLPNEYAEIGELPSVAGKRQFSACPVYYIICICVFCYVHLQHFFCFVWRF